MEINSVRREEVIFTLGMSRDEAEAIAMFIRKVQDNRMSVFDSDAWSDMEPEEQGAVACFLQSVESALRHATERLGKNP